MRPQIIFKNNQEGLSGFALKYLAMALMAFDHIEYFLLIPEKVLSANLSSLSMDLRIGY